MPVTAGMNRGSSNSPIAGSSWIFARMGHAIAMVQSQDPLHIMLHHTSGNFGESDIMRDQYTIIVTSQAKFDELKSRERLSSSSYDERDAPHQSQGWILCSVANINE